MSPENESTQGPGARLPEGLRQGGWQLIETLDAAGRGPDAAFWLWFPDVEDWRLMFAGGPLFEGGAKAAHRRLRETVQQLGRPGGLQLKHLGVAKEDARSVALIREAVYTGPGIHGIRIRDNVIGGRRIRRAYVYRVM
ncbi:MAG: hypothetical protein R3266_07085 [Gemmatimonadota bacterium]|nr:hypothetical protein [Gemmatimonadota bacterium]